MNKLAKKDLYEAPDYYQLDELLSEEHLLIRSTVRDWVIKEVSPIIEDYAQRAEFPKHLIKGLGEIGAFGPTIPVEYGGAGLDYTAYGIIMQEIERGDSGIRSIEFTNTGESPLQIFNVLSTPGFTISSLPTTTIAPGKTGKIDIKCNMAPGPIRKTITVESNAINYEGGRIPLKIKGEVIAD